MRGWLAAAVLIVGVAGCSAVPVSGAYTPDELRQRCQREGGWWKAHDQPPSCEMRGS